MFERHIEKLYLINMNLQSSEGLLLITDDTRDYLADLLLGFYNVGSELARWVKKVCYGSLGVHGKEPPEEVWKVTFGDKAVDVLRETGLFEKVLNKENYSEEEVVNILRSYAEEVPNVVIAFPYYSTKKE
jgi:aminopeptidase